MGMASQAHAEQKTLYVGMNGGDMERTFTQHVFPVFERANNVKIVVVPGTSADILAKAQAYKDNPQMHVMFLDDGVMMRAASMGLCDKLNDSPVFKELHPNARIAGDKAAGITMGMTGIAYNTKMFQEKGWAPPASWMDLADPKYKGHVVFQSAASSTFGLHGFLMFNRIQGGSESNVEPGFKAWKGTIGKNVLEYITSSAKLAEMVQTNEAAVFPMNITGVSRLKRRNIGVEYAHPKEGAALLMVTECVLAKNSEPELAQKLALYLLSAEAQTNALEQGGEIPSNATVKPSEKTAAEVQRVQDYLKTVKVVDWEAINQSRQTWNARWNRTIEQ
ncbi:extracellular solute-binding protein [Pusillimonas sp. TS35]|uniref:ABC transporter substrate-binding protein n=1 Tax=Paracandidimonas lactea TaxID=2895524 RepID=UPI0013684876|nr:ABC transporter substrate-binding protein [Paracandidimonas lactea]MYN13691.1 extracellular solute-binding protein [Pusillimonas sp. TS35]